METPDNKSYLFDAGSITHKDPGCRVVIPFLKYRGIQSLDAAFISHGDLDHFNGLPEIASAGFVKTVYANNGLLEKAPQYGAPKTLVDVLGESRVPLKPAADFALPNGPATVRTLWPKPDSSADTLSENDRSEVFLVAYAGKTILLCGDIEAYAQKEILALYPHLKVDILILPHHGSTVNLSHAFINQIASDIIIASCAESRLAAVYQSPLHPNTFYTGRDGAVQIKIKADGTIHAAGFVNHK